MKYFAVFWKKCEQRYCNTSNLASMLHKHTTVTITCLPQHVASITVYIMQKSFLLNDLTFIVYMTLIIAKTDLDTSLNNN
jgi:hypothetical protein